MSRAGRCTTRPARAARPRQHRRSPCSHRRQGGRRALWWAAMLVVKELTKRFGERVAVDSLDFQVRAGEILGLVGPNGAGKTTTLRCVAGILAPDAGSIAV